MALLEAAPLSFPCFQVNRTDADVAGRQWETQNSNNKKTSQRLSSPRPTAATTAPSLKRFLPDWVRKWPLSPCSAQFPAYLGVAHFCPLFSGMYARRGEGREWSKGLEGRLPRAHNAKKKPLSPSRGIIKFCRSPPLYTTGLCRPPPPPQIPVSMPTAHFRSPHSFLRPNPPLLRRAIESKLPQNSDTKGGWKRGSMRRRKTAKETGDGGGSNLFLSSPSLFSNLRTHMEGF